MRHVSTVEVHRWTIPLNTFHPRAMCDTTPAPASDPRAGSSDCAFVVVNGVVQCPPQSDPLISSEHDLVQLILRCVPEDCQSEHSSPSVYRFLPLPLAPPAPFPLGVVLGVGLALELAFGFGMTLKKLHE